MKNAKTYETKVRKMLGKLSASASLETDTDEPIPFLVRAVLQADVPDPADSERAFQAIQREYVDYNELRVSLPKDITDAVGPEFPNIRRKARMITDALNRIYQRDYVLSMDYMADMAKRDLRRHLQEIGLDDYAGALIVLGVYDGHAIPVDRSLVDALLMDELVHPETDVPDVQGFLERIIPAKHGIAAHLALRRFVQSKAKPLEALNQRRREEAEAAAAEKAAKAAKAEAASSDGDKTATDTDASRASKGASKPAKSTGTSGSKSARQAKTSKGKAAKKSAGKSSKTAKTAKSAKKPKSATPSKASAKRSKTAKKRSKKAKSKAKKTRKTAKRKKSR